MKIKIAVATGFTDDDEPTWQAFGFKSAETWAEAMESFEMLIDEHRFFVTAEIPDPVKQVPEISGEASSLAEAEA